MAQITLKGNAINTIGNLPEVGTFAPNFTLVKNDLSTGSLSDYKGKKVVLNIFPSLDTGTCASSVRRFNQETSKLDNTVVLCISKDLPFAQSRFCGAEGLDDVHTLSDFRTGQFGKDYGVEIIDGPLAWLESRAVVIIDEEGIITYTQQVPEIIDEPNYDSALAVL
ncbi:MAG: thiol peroxidase [Bacteroidetes bacterium]|nr:thiol peroxidase [Bacteroidota bacterium]MBL6942848.1 thiol peroxidase [Bacteroidales bacterium]